MTEHERQLIDAADVLQSVAARLELLAGVDENDEPDRASILDVLGSLGTISDLVGKLDNLPEVLASISKLTEMLGGLGNLAETVSKISDVIPQVVQLIEQVNAILGKLNLPNQPVTPPVSAAGVNRALCIGINYEGTQNALRGCLNDMKDWSQLLSSRSFSVRHLPENQATKSGIIGEISAVIRVCNPNDRLWITYSAHGSWLPDRNGDESDNRDECWVPYDHATVGMLLDDDLGALLETAPCPVILISDSCHSGTMSRGGVLVNNFAGRFLPPPINQHRADLLASNYRPLHTSERVAPASNVLLLSGCQDNEFSADANLNGRWCGAFSHHALDTLKQAADDWTFRDWMTAIRRRLPSRQFRQTPGIVGSAEMQDQRIFP